MSNLWGKAGGTDVFHLELTGASCRFWCYSDAFSDASVARQGIYR